MTKRGPTPRRQPPAAGAAGAAGDTSPGVKPDAKPTPPPRPPGRPSNADRMTEALTEQFVSIGAMVMVADAFDGMVIVAKGPELAAALVQLGETNPAVKRALAKLLDVGGWAAVVTVAASIAVPIAAHHGLLPSGLVALAPADAQALAGLDVGGLLGNLGDLGDIVAGGPSPAADAVA